MNVKEKRRNSLKRRESRGAQPPRAHTSSLVVSKVRARPAGGYIGPLQGGLVYEKEESLLDGVVRLAAQSLRKAPIFGSRMIPRIEMRDTMELTQGDSYLKVIQHTSQ